MPIVLPTVENIEEHLQHVEEVVISVISTAAPDLPNGLRNVVQRLQDDLARFWPQALPSLPDITLPSLGAFEVPPPPPPLPVPKSALEGSADWVGAHPWKAVGLGIGIVGVGVVAGRGMRSYLRPSRPRRTTHGVVGSSEDGEKRQVVGEYRDHSRLLRYLNPPRSRLGR